MEKEHNTDVNMDVKDTDDAMDVEISASVVQTRNMRKRKLEQKEQNQPNKYQKAEEEEDEDLNRIWEEIERDEPKICSDPEQAITKLKTLGTDLDALRKRWIALEKYCYNHNRYKQAIKKIKKKLDEGGPMRNLLREIEDKSRAAKEAFEKLKDSGAMDGLANALKIAAKAKYIFLTFPANIYFSVLGVGLKLWQGRCYGMLGEFRKAYECFMKGVEAFSNFERTINNVEKTLNSIPSELLAEVKKIKDVEQLFTDKDTFTQQTLPSFKTTMCFSIIILYIMNGDITNAIQWFDKEWNDLSHLKEEELPSAFHSSPIMPHLSKGDIKEMMRIRTTLETFVRSESSAAKKAFACNILGILCQYLQKQEDSEKYHKDSLLLYEDEQVKNIDGILASHFNLGHLALFVSPNAEDALHHFTEIINLTKQDRNGELQRAQILLGFALILDSKYGPAKDNFNAEPCPDIKEEYFVIMRFYGLALACFKLGQYEEAKEYIIECVKRSKNTLHHASNSHLLLSAFELHAQLSELYQLVHVALGDIPSAIEVSDWFKLSLTSLTYDANAELREEVAVTVNQVQDLLDETSAIVVYSSCKDVFEKTRADYIYLISKKEVREVTKGLIFKRAEQPYSAVPVSDINNATRGGDPEPIGQDDTDPYPPALHEALKPFSHVGFVFQRKWSNPAAFTTSSDNSSFLIKEKFVCILPSLFWFVKQRSVGFTRQVPIDASTATLLGGLTNGNLPNVKEEVDKIKECLQVTHPTPLIDTDFCRDRVLKHCTTSF